MGRCLRAAWTTWTGEATSASPRPRSRPSASRRWPPRWTRSPARSRPCSSWSKRGATWTSSSPPTSSGSSAAWRCRPGRRARRRAGCARRCRRSARGPWQRWGGPSATTASRARCCGSGPPATPSGRWSSRRACSPWAARRPPGPRRAAWPCRRSWPTSRPRCSGPCWTSPPRPWCSPWRRAPTPCPSPSGTRSSRAGARSWPRPSWPAARTSAWWRPSRAPARAAGPPWRPSSWRCCSRSWRCRTSAAPRPERPCWPTPRPRRPRSPTSSSAAPTLSGSSWPRSRRPSASSCPRSSCTTARTSPTPCRRGRPTPGGSRTAARPRWRTPASSRPSASSRPTPAWRPGPGRWRRRWRSWTRTRGTAWRCGWATGGAP
mmetsp:Transcript_38898/g.120765  ORF Transcript_38898/g.120765 Transcript_38898/m.120765 type:complete len:376 (-) Transcript_38898:82-1209(-)